VRFEHRLVLLASFVAAPGLIAALVLLWIVDLPQTARITITLTLVAATLFMIQILRRRTVFPIRTLSSVVAGIREQDYTLRFRESDADDALADLAAEVNLLTDAMRQRHFDNEQTSALVRAVLGELDSAIFLFDRKGRLQQTNRAGERLLRIETAEAIGKTIEELSLTACVAQPLPATIEMAFPGGSGRWAVRHSVFREKDGTHLLLTISDLSRALRDEELLAWQRLARVLTHELNNSLASIRSIVGTLQQIVLSDQPPDDWRDDAKRGFEVIASRVESLTRFARAYGRLARLPQPDRAPVAIETLVDRVAALSFALPIRVAAGPAATLFVDSDQIEQLLINIVQNAVDAAVETGGDVTIGWEVLDGSLQLSVLDEGPGLSSTKNLFVPFFTTKPEGTGIGLVLSRQIAEAHQGTLTLRNRDSGGCEAMLTLPIVRAS
jgi:nitrogen fixation/metabolism regulation signal transduction histidine kinase